MTELASEITIAMRIPGRWTDPGALIRGLPAGYRLTPDALFLPDGTEIGFGAMDADDQFAAIFRQSCRQPATADELEDVDNYTVNVLLSGPGGSMQSAHAMMKAAAAIIRAGGAGVFIDNCTLAHGGQDWLTMTDDGGPDAISFAFAAIIRGKTDEWTMGLHALGLRDIVMKRKDIEDGFDIVEVIRYVCKTDDPIENGHIIADLSGPRFQAFTENSPDRFADSAMHNPFGRLKLLSLRDAGQNN